MNIAGAESRPVQPTGRLVTINLNTYKASRINSFISNLRMRIEPIESYYSECQKKEAKFRKEQQEKLREEKKKQKLAEKEQKKHQS